jgi:hypothetical protein
MYKTTFNFYGKKQIIHKRNIAVSRLYLQASQQVSRSIVNYTKESAIIWLGVNLDLE